MPSGQVTPPPPAGEYKLSEHQPGMRQNTPTAVTDALRRAAKISPISAPPVPPPAAPAKPEPTPTQQQQEAPVTRIEPPIPKPVDQKPPPRYVPPDEQEPAPAKPAPTTEPQAKATAPQEDATAKPNAEAIKLANSQLRDAYEKLKSDFTQKAEEGELTKKELDKFKRQTAEFQERIKAGEQAEKQAKELQSRLVSMDERLRVTDYLNHPEFHEKYTKPLSDALENGRDLAKQLIVDSEGNPRAGTAQDFDEILSAPSLTEAHRRAKELFGSEFAPTVLAERSKVLSAQRAKEQAAKDAAIKSQEWIERRSVQEQEQRVKSKAEFERIASELETKYPEIYTAPKDDEKLSEALNIGRKTAQLVLEGDPEGNQENYRQALARAYHRTSAFPMLLVKNQRLSEEVESLKSKLARYEKTEPGNSGRMSSDGSTTAQDQRDPKNTIRKGLQAIADSHR